MSEPTVGGVYHTPYGPVTAYTRPYTQDSNTLIAILQQDEYHVTNQTWDGKFCIDVGGHIGGMTMLLLKGGAEFVRVVEPLPENVELLRYNLAANGWGDDRVEVIHGAVGDASQSALQVVDYTQPTVHDPENIHKFIGHTLSVSDVIGPDSMAIPISAVICRTVPFSELVAGHDVWDLLKIDCEGAEWELFRGASHADVRKVLRFVGELHHEGASGLEMRDTLWDVLGTEYSLERANCDGDDVVSLCHTDFAR